MTLSIAGYLSVPLAVLKGKIMSRLVKSVLVGSATILMSFSASAAPVHHLPPPLTALSPFCLGSAPIVDVCTDTNETAVTGRSIAGVGVGVEGIGEKVGVLGTSTSPNGAAGVFNSAA